MAASYIWPQGNDHSLFYCQLTDANGTTGVDLTGVAFSAITLVLAPDYGNGVTGSFTALAGAVQQFTDISNGKFTYKFAAADVATAGSYQLAIVVDYGSGDILRSLPMPFTIIRTE